MGRARASPARFRVRWPLPSLLPWPRMAAAAWPCPERTYTTLSTSWSLTVSSDGGGGRRHHHWARAGASAGGRRTSCAVSGGTPGSWNDRAAARRSSTRASSDSCSVDVIDGVRWILQGREWQTNGRSSDGGRRLFVGWPEFQGRGSSVPPSVDYKLQLRSSVSPSAAPRFHVVLKLRAGSGPAWPDASPSCFRVVLGLRFKRWAHFSPARKKFVLPRPEVFKPEARWVRAGSARPGPTCRTTRFGLHGPRPGKGTIGEQYPWGPHPLGLIAFIMDLALCPLTSTRVCIALASLEGYFAHSVKSPFLELVHVVLVACFHRKN
jgi:hypothetical protein